MLGLAGMFLREESQKAGRKFGGGGNVCFPYFDCGDVSQMCTYVKIYYVQFIESQLYFNSVLKFKKDTRQVQK